MAASRRASFGRDAVRFDGDRVFVVGEDVLGGTFPPGTWEDVAWQAAAQQGGSASNVFDGTATLIDYTIATTFDVVRALARGLQPAGSHRLSWDGRDDGGRRVSAGIYFLSLTAEDGAARRRAVVLR